MKVSDVAADIATFLQLQLAKDDALRPARYKLLHPNSPPGTGCIQEFAAPPLQNNQKLNEVAIDIAAAARDDARGQSVPVEYKLCAYVEETQVARRAVVIEPVLDGSAPLVSETKTATQTIQKHSERLMGALERSIERSERISRHHVDALMAENEKLRKHEHRVWERERKLVSDDREGRLLEERHKRDFERESKWLEYQDQIAEMAMAKFAEVIPHIVNKVNAKIKGSSNGDAAKAPDVSAMVKRELKKEMPNVVKALHEALEEEPDGTAGPSH